MLQQSWLSEEEERAWMSLSIQAFLPACQLTLALSRFNWALKAASLPVVRRWSKEQ